MLQTAELGNDLRALPRCGVSVFLSWGRTWLVFIRPGRTCLPGRWSICVLKAKSGEPSINSNSEASY